MENAVQPFHLSPFMRLNAEFAVKSQYK